MLFSSVSRLPLTSRAWWRSRSPPPPETWLNGVLVGSSGPRPLRGGFGGCGLEASSWLAPGTPQRSVLGSLSGMSAVLLLVLHGVDVLAPIAIAALFLEVHVAVAGIAGLGAGDLVTALDVGAFDMRLFARVGA